MIAESGRRVSTISALERSQLKRMDHLRDQNLKVWIRYLTLEVEVTVVPKIYIWKVE